MPTKRGRKKNLTGEKIPYRKRYSVYHRKNDVPLILYATAAECAAAMGIRLDSFYRHMVRERQGKVRLRKWAVYEDETDEIEEDNQ